MMSLLFKVKSIRNFLSLYKEEFWEKLISSMTEYGILILKKKKNISSMSVDDIINFVEDFKRVEGISISKNNQRISNKSKGNRRNSFNNSLNKSITSNYSSKSVNRNKNYSVKTKTKSKNKNFKRNESFSYNKKVNKFNNKSFSSSENIPSKNNYTRIKIYSNRGYISNNSNKDDNIGGQLFKDSFNSLSSKEAFFTKKKSKKPNNYKKSFKNNNEEAIKKNNMNNNNQQNKKRVKKTENKKKITKVESKIKDLIQKDKSNFVNTGNNNFNTQVYSIPMKAIEDLGSLRSNNDIPTKTSNDSLRINITNKTNNEINTQINNNNSISTITSLEDKLNGLTLKLSKLNESINNNKKKLSSYSNLEPYSQFNQNDNSNDVKSPFINIGLGNTVINNQNFDKFQPGQMEYNQLNFNSDGNKNDNDEDYLGEEQLNL